MEIPNVGRFLIRNQVAAIDFDEFLVLDTLVSIKDKPMLIIKGRNE